MVNYIKYGYLLVQLTVCVVQTIVFFIFRPNPEDECWIGSEDQISCDTVQRNPDYVNVTSRWLTWFTLCQCLYGLNIFILIGAGIATRKRGIIAVAFYMVDSVVIDLLAIPIIIYGAIARFGAYGRIAAENNELDISAKFMIYKNIQ